MPTLVFFYNFSMFMDLLLIACAFLSGAMNSVAGGGTFFTFPALLYAGVTPVMANATCSLIVFPASFSSAFAYRQELKSQKDFPLLVAILPSLIGGWLGAQALLATPDKTFVGLIPWLMLSATLLFAYGKAIGDWLRARMHIGLPALVLLLLVIGFYGGYFGAGIGIMTLALMGLLGLSNLHEMNAAKTVLTGIMNLAAVVNFVLNGAVHWHYAIFMGIASIIGGYVGAAVARRLNQNHVRFVVITFGVVLTLHFFGLY